MSHIYKISFVFLLLVTSCNGKNLYTNNTDALTQYPEYELVTFSISGSAACNDCDPKNITALQVDVVPSADPMTTLSMNVFEGLGPFSFDDLRYTKGMKLTIYGKLFFESGSYGRDTSTEITVPQDDNKMISCILNF